MNKPLWYSVFYGNSSWKLSLNTHFVLLFRKPQLQEALQHCHKIRMARRWWNKGEDEGTTGTVHRQTGLDIWGGNVPVTLDHLSWPTLLYTIRSVACLGTCVYLEQKLRDRSQKSVFCAFSSKVLRPWEYLNVFLYYTLYICHNTNFGNIGSMQFISWMISMKLSGYYFVMPIQFVEKYQKIRYTIFDKPHWEYGPLWRIF
jgi:hypothetical protein